MHSLELRNTFIANGVIFLVPSKHYNTLPLSPPLIEVVPQVDIPWPSCEIPIKADGNSNSREIVIYISKGDFYGRDTLR